MKILARQYFSPWYWPGTLAVLALIVAFAYHDYPAASFFQTDDYVWRLWAKWESNPWRAFSEDLAAGQAFRPLRYLSWYCLELLIPSVPWIVPATVLSGFILYGCSAGVLAFQLSRDRWVGATTAMLTLLYPLLGPGTLLWYSVLEDMMPPALLLLSCISLIHGVHTRRNRWIVASLVPALLAGLWKESSFVVPALAFLVLAGAYADRTGSGVRVQSPSSSVTALLHKSPEPQPSPHPSPLAARGEGGRSCFESRRAGGPGEGWPVNCEAMPSVTVMSGRCALLRALGWSIPFGCLVGLLFIWRFWVIGSSGLIGHHGLLFADPAARIEQLINLAGLAGSLPIGLFYAPAVERSFPISMKAAANAWSVTEQLVCLLILSITWLTWVWFSPKRKTLITAGIWYAFGWLPAMALTVVQPSYLYLPVFAVSLLLALALRELIRHPAVFATVTIAAACALSIMVAGRLRAAVPVAEAVRSETESLLEKIRQESPQSPAGTRVILVGSRVLRPDLVAELDAAYRHERCNLDLYNFDAAPVELIVPATPLDEQSMGPLVISTEGLRDGHITMAGRQLYFIDLRGTKQQLADPRLNNRFWAPTPTGWQEITDLIQHAGAW